MKPALLLFSVIFCSCGAIADEGFFPIDDPSIPLKVQEAAKSVFILALESGGKIITEEEYDEYGTQKWAWGTVNGGIVVDLINNAIKDKKSKCFIPSFSESSSFLYENNQTLMTAYHVVKGHLNVNEDHSYKLKSVVTIQHF